jgi:hypothetical protein
LAENSIAFKVDPGLRKVEYTFSTGEGVDWNAGISGTANDAIPGVATGNLGIKFSFSSSGAFAFSATGCQIDNIASLDNVLETMVDRLENWNWKDDWIVVTGLVTADRYAIAVSAKEGASASLDLGVTAGPPILANASANAAFTTSEHMASAVISTNPAPVMFEGWKVDKHFFKRPTPHRVYLHLPSPVA